MLKCTFYNLIKNEKNYQTILTVRIYEKNNQTLVTVRIYETIYITTYFFLNLYSFINFIILKNCKKDK